MQVQGRGLFHAKGFVGIDMEFVRVADLGRFFLMDVGNLYIIEVDWAMKFAVRLPIVRFVQYVDEFPIYFF